VFSDGTTQDVTTQATWSSGSPGVATVSNAAGSQGLASAVDLGQTTIQATFGGFTGATSLTVTAATLSSIQVTPTNATIADGTTLQYTATGIFSDGTTQNLTGSVTWASSTSTVATISNATGSKGLATAVDPGSTTISATSGAIVGSTSLTVTAATLVSIQVTPTNPSIADGTSLQFTAIGTYTDNSTQDLTTQATWSTSNANTATISNAAGTRGRATAEAVGTTTITALFGAVSGSTTLTVTAATLQSIQDGLLARAKAFRKEHTRRIDSRDEFYEFFTTEREEEGKPTPIHGGFALTHFSGEVELEKRIKDDLSVTVRCIPLEKSQPGTCPLTGKPSAQRVVWAKSY